ncbi:MAG: DUF6489 family protein [Arenicellales bacterium WSBS_2016_MAG_OTU3]
MKFKIEIDCTPEEARKFLGLPDVAELQTSMLDNIKAKMEQGAEGFDPVSLMRPFLPEGMQNLDVLQKAFWQAAGGGMKKSDDN